MVTSMPSQGVAIDSRYTPLHSLIQYVEGSSWTVNYYSQILNSDDATNAQQVDLNPIYQQYLLIHQLEMRVQSPLSQQQNQQSKEMEVVGSALLYPGLIPNKGDMFIADIGDGRGGLFAITTVEKKSLLKDSLYSIEYVLKEYTTPENLGDLKRKTIREARFVKDYLKYGQNPQVMAPDYADLKTLSGFYDQLVGQYFQDFYSNDYQTLILPDQTMPTYDPFLTKALMSWVTVEEHPFVQRIRQPNVSSEAVMNTPTVWDALGRMNRGVLAMAARKMVVVSTRAFFSQADFGGIYYTGLTRVVYPVEGRTDVDRGHGLPSMTAGFELNASKSRWEDIERREIITDLPEIAYLPTGVQDLPAISAVNSLETYLFSEAFYKGQEPLASKLEKLVKDAIVGDALDTAILKSVVESTPHWGMLEQFYYIPVLIALLKSKLRTN